MRKHNRFASRLVAAMETMELRRLLSTVTGTIYSDTNRNGRLDTGEPGLANRTVYADYNYNGALDASEPRVTSNASGNYSLTTREQYVQLSLVTNPGEQITLGYGATSIWLPTVIGTVSGKNIGVASTGPMTGEVRLELYIDTNRNNVRDAGERLRQIRAFWEDLNDNGQFDPGEPNYNNSQPVPADYYKLELSLGSHRIRYQTSTWDILDGTSVLDVTLTSGQPVQTFTQATIWNETTYVVSGFVYYDLNHNGYNDSEGVAGQTVYADYNLNGIRDPAEPSSVTDSNGAYLFEINRPSLTLKLIPSADYTPVAPYALAVYTYAGHNTVAPTFAVAPVTSSTITGTVYADTNRNGRREAGEVGLANRAVFADYNYNGVLDPLEPSAITDANGAYSLGTRPQHIQLSLVTLPGEQITLGYGATTLWLSTVNGTVTGKNFGVAGSGAASITGFVYLDLNGNGQRDSGDQFSNLSVVVFVDTDHDGIWGANGAAEPGTTVSLVDGSYTITGVVAGVYVPVRAILLSNATLPATVFVEPSTWNDPSRTVLTTAGATSGGNFGLTRRNVGYVTAFAFDDVNGDGQIASYEPDAPLADAWLDLNANDLLDVGEPQFATGFYGTVENRRRYYYLAAPYGFHRVAIRFQGDSDHLADMWRVVNLGPGTGATHFGRPTVASVSGTVFADADRDGRLDVGESGLTGRKVFVDSNFNGVFDEGEAFALTDSTGAYTLLPFRPTFVDVRLSLNANESLSLGYTGYWFQGMPGPVTGKNFGVIT